MLDAAEKFEAAFVRLQYHDAKYKKHFEKEKIKGPPEKEEWSRLRVFVKFLKMFYDVTLKFSESLYVTSNIFFFLKNWWLCKEHCKKWLMGGIK